MLLSATTESIQVSKAAGVTTTAPDAYATYVDATSTTFTPGVQRTALSSGAGTDDTVVSAPSASTSRQIKYLSIFNRDTVTHTFTVQHDLSSTDFFIAQLVLLPNQMADYVSGKGWRVHDTGGFPITVADAAEFASVYLAGSTRITSGQVSLNNSGLDWGINGQTVTAREGVNFNSQFWANLDAHGTTMSLLSNNVVGSLMVFPINPSGDLRFPGAMTVSSLYMGFSGSQTNTAASSTSNAYTWSFGLYTLNGSTLSLLNSGSASASIGSGSDCTSGMHGARFLNLATSAWSAPIVLSNGVYYMGILQTTAGGQTKSLAYLGWQFITTQQWSGFIGTSQVTATSQGLFPFGGVMATAGIPTTIQQSQLNKANVSTGFVPYMVFNNFSSLL